MKIVEINPHGKLKRVDLTRKQIVKSFSIHTRDLRPVFLLSQVATIFSRGNVLIVNLGFIKLLISPEKLFIFNTESPDIQENFIPYMAEKLKNYESASHEPVDFEIKVLDSAFMYKLKKLRKDIIPLKENMESTLLSLETNPTNAALGGLLLLKKKLSKFQITVTENEAATLEVLEEDETLAQLCISQMEENIEIEEVDIDEIESVLDSFSEQIEQISYQLKDMKENVDDTQEIFSLKLHNRRNAIIKIDLLITVITGIFSFLAVITGFYGMNIKNNVENNSEIFSVMAIGFILFFMITLALLWRNLKQKHIL